jgi:hypothetical protein
MSEIKLDTILGSQPIVGPYLRTLTLPADPTADEVSLDRVATYISIVPIEKSVTYGAADRQIRVDALHTQIKLGSFGKM